MRTMKRTPRAGLSERRAVIGAVVLIMVCFWAAGSPGGADEEPTLADLADYEIGYILTSLSAVGDYDSCLALYDTLLARDHSTFRSMPWQVPVYLVAQKTLAYILTLSPEAQADLARADTLYYPQWFAWTGGRFAEGLEMARQQMALRRRYLGEKTLEIAQSHMEIGKFLASLGNHAEAVDHCCRARDIYSSILGRDHPHTAGALASLGSLYADRGDFDEAEPLLRENLAIVRASYPEAHRENNHAVVRLAILYHHMGDLNRAESLMRDALVWNLRRYGRLHWMTATLHHNLGSVHAKQGDYGTAIPLLEEALDLRLELLGEDHPHVFQTMSTLGMALRNQGRLAEAEPLLRRALALSEAAPGETYSTTHDLTNLAAVLASKREFAEAESLSREAIDLARRTKGDSHPDLASLLMPGGSILMAQDRWDEAEAYLLEAVGVAERAVGVQHPLTCRTLSMLASCRLGQGRVASAESLLVESAQVFEFARLDAGEGYRRATFQNSPHALLALARLRQGRMGEAWVSAERAQGRALADLLLSGNQEPASPGDRATLDSLRAVLHEREIQVVAVRSTDPEPTRYRPNELDRAQAALSEAELAVARLERSMRQSRGLEFADSLDLEQIQGALPNRGAIVGWLHLRIADRDFSAWAYVIPKAGPVRWVELELGEEVDINCTLVQSSRDFRERVDIASSWRFRIADCSSWKRQAADLWRRWGEPVEPFLTDVDCLVVIPNGPLCGLPVEALVDAKGRYLADRFSISYAPSASLFAHLAHGRSERPEDWNRRGLFVGDPPFCDDHLFAMTTEPDGKPGQSGGPLMASALRGVLSGDPDAMGKLPRVPWTRTEIRGAARHAQDATILLGIDASEQELGRLAESGALAEYSLLHFATHAVIDNDLPDHSAIVLSQVGLPDPMDAVISHTPLVDGLLTAKEIVSEWRLEADLVTLSGCQTALGRETPGEGHIGLASAFLQAGARSLLVSLWRVEDRASALLMDRFYENLDEHPAGAHRKAQALRAAKHWLRDYTDEHGDQPFRHPVYWSGFVLLGEP